MFQTRGRKIWRDIASRRVRTALVAMSIFVGVVGVTGLVSAGDLLVSRLQADLQPEALPMLEQTIDLLDEAEPMEDQAFLDTLNSHPGVISLDAMVVDRVYWRPADAPDAAFIESRLRAYWLDYADVTIEPMTLIEGHYPVAGQREFVIERRMAEEYNLASGDQITVRNLKDINQRTDPTAPIPEETWTISGIIRHPYVIRTTDAFYSTIPDVRSLTDNRGFTFIRARFTDYATAESEAAAFEERLETQTPYESTLQEIFDPAHHILIETVADWTYTVVLLGVVAMLVCSFLVFNVISTIVAEQRHQIGVMKSLGASRWDSFSIYAGIALTYGILGTIPGVIIGALVGHQVLGVIAPLINILVDGFSISSLGVGVGMTLGLTIPLLAALLPVYQGTRISIIEAMTDLGLASTYGQGRVDRFIKALPVSITIRQAFANIIQKRGRLALTVFTLTIAIAAFMGVSAVFISLNKVTDRLFETYNFQMGLLTQREADIEQAGELAAARPEIESVHPGMPAEVTLRHGDQAEIITIWGFDTSTTAIDLQLNTGTGWLDDPNRAGIVLTSSLAERLGKGLNESVILEHEGRTLELPIIGLDSYPAELGFMQWQALAEITGQAHPGMMLIKLRDEDLTGADVEQEIGEMREVMLQHGIITGYYNQLADAEDNSETIQTLGVLLNFASAVMAAVGLIGLVIVLSMSVYERQREIGVMRSVGAASSTIAGQFLVEGMLIGVLAWVLAIPVSVLLARLLLLALPLEDFGFRYPVAVIGAGLVGIVVFAFLASLAPALSAARKTVSEILRYQ